MSHAKPFEIVLFGATGFTGRLTAEYLARASTPRPLRWAIAGRSREKLDALRLRLAQLGPNGARVELIVADVNDPASLRELARSADVVATTVGPYIRYGEPLVRACVEEGAHYVDLTGEPEFVDLVIDRYHDEAARKELKIVNACGFDSIPHDLGALFTLKQLERRLSPSARGETPVSIEGFVRMHGSVSGGTWHSAITAMGRMRTYQSLRKTLRRPPQVGEHRKIGGIKPHIAYQRDLKLWALPMPTIDPLVVQRSARLSPEYGPDFRYGHYLGLRKLTKVVGLVASVSAVFALAQLKPTRGLLLKVKDPGQGPSEEERKKASFKVIFRGRAGGHEVLCEVRGGDPGYDETAKMLAESALTLVFDRERAPKVYGVVPPAASLGMPLLERLRAAGISFTDVTPDAERAQVGATQAAVSG